MTRKAGVAEEKLISYGADITELVVHGGTMHLDSGHIRLCLHGCVSRSLR
jgi:hypothetical protein